MFKFFREELYGVNPAVSYK